MSRQARLLKDGGYYHITTRGNDRTRIFRSDSDFIYFIKLIKEALEKNSIHIHHYCLMNNHLHFLISVIDSSRAPKFFQNIFQRYACYFRKRYRHVGYLFQNRYKSNPIEKESYSLECSRYIERNPVRAGIVKDPADYRWSSYSYYAFGEKDDIVTPNPAYIELSKDDEDRKRLYREYVLQERLYEHIVDKGLGIG